MAVELIMSRLGYWIGHELLMAIRWNNSKDKGKAELKSLIQKLLTLTKFAKVGKEKEILFILTNSQSRPNYPSSMCS